MIVGTGSIYIVALTHLGQNFIDIIDSHFPAMQSILQCKVQLQLLKLQFFHLLKLKKYSTWTKVL